MARKLMISEGFRDGKDEITMTARIPDSLYRAIDEDAKGQGVPISVVLRDLLAFHYLPEHLVGKLKKGSKLEPSESVLLESVRGHVSKLVECLDEIDKLRGRVKTLDPELKALIQEEVNERMGRFDWNKIKARTQQKKGGKR